MDKTDTYETIVHIRKLIEIARLAPSVHNVQPWYFTYKGDVLSLYIHNERRLYAGDPTLRELWLSMGIMFETLMQTATALGIRLRVETLQTQSLDQPVARIRIVGLETRNDSATINLMKNRYTHRGRLAKKAVDPSVVQQLVRIPETNQIQGVQILTTTRKDDIELASRLTRRGLQLALSSTSFRHELSHLIRPNWTHARTGLPGFVLNKNALGALWEKWTLQFNIGNTKKASLEEDRVRNAPLLLFINTTGDVPSHWFAAGRVYILTTLELTRYGLCHSTLAAPVEAGDLHEELETALHTTLRAQTMLLVGYPETRSKKHPTTPRLSVDELLILE